MSMTPIRPSARRVSGRGRAVDWFQAQDDHVQRALLTGGSHVAVSVFPLGTIVNPLVAVSGDVAITTGDAVYG